MFSELLKQKRFLLTAQAELPGGADVRLFRQELAKMKVDALVFPELSPHVHLSAFSGALIAKAEKKEPILEFACSQKPIKAIQAELIGASALEIQNVMCCDSGNPETDSLALLKLVKQLNKGLSVDGEKLVGRTNLFAGAKINLSAPSRKEMEAARKKLLNGAEFFQTTLAFDLAGLESMLGEYEKAFKESLRDRVIVSVFLLSSSEQLASLKKNALVPPAVEKRMKNASREMEEGAKISMELIEKAKSMKVGGVNLVFDKNFGLLQKAIDAVRGQVYACQSVA